MLELVVKLCAPLFNALTGFSMQIQQSIQRRPQQNNKTSLSLWSFRSHPECIHTRFIAQKIQNAKLLLSLIVLSSLRFLSMLQHPENVIKSLKSDLQWMEWQQNCWSCGRPFKASIHLHTTRQTIIRHANQTSTATISHPFTFPLALSLLSQL